MMREKLLEVQAGDIVPTSSLSDLKPVLCSQSKEKVHPQFLIQSIRYDQVTLLFEWRSKACLISEPFVLFL